MSDRARRVGAALALLVSGWAWAGTVDRVAAVVNDEVVALSEVYDIGGDFIGERCGRALPADCVREGELEVLDSLILRVLIRQELVKLELDVSAEELDRTIDQVMRDNRMDDRATFRKAVEAQGVSWDTYREELTEQIRQMKFNEVVIRPRITVTEEEALDRYRRSVRDFQAPPSFELGALAMRIPKDSDAETLIQLVATARDVARQVNAGEITWADALSRYDAGVFSQKEDGHLGTFKQGEALPEIEKAALSVKVGQVSDPVKVGDSLFLIKLLSIQESADVRSYEDAKGAIFDRLYEEKTEAEVERWYQQARRQAAIKILLEGT
jgi:peptidyl-prolyl cis-trans isomerase SurA